MSSGFLRVVVYCGSSFLRLNDVRLYVPNTAFRLSVHRTDGHGVLHPLTLVNDAAKGRGAQSYLLKSLPLIPLDKCVYPALELPHPRAILHLIALRTVQLFSAAAVLLYILQRYVWPASLASLGAECLSWGQCDYARIRDRRQYLKI